MSLSSHIQNLNPSKQQKVDSVASMLELKFQIRYGCYLIHKQNSKLLQSSSGWLCTKVLRDVKRILIIIL